MAPQEKGARHPSLAQLPLAEIVPARKRVRGAVVGTAANRFYPLVGPGWQQWHSWPLEVWPLEVWPLELEHQVMGVNIVEQCAGTLVEQVGIEALRLEQRDPPLPGRTLRLHGRELAGKLRDLLVDVLPGIEPVIAG